MAVDVIGDRIGDHIIANPCEWGCLRDAAWSYLHQDSNRVLAAFEAEAKVCCA